MKTFARFLFRPRCSLFQAMGMGLGAALWPDLPIAGMFCGGLIAGCLGVVGSFWAEWEG